MICYHYDRSGANAVGTIFQLSSPHDIPQLHPEVTFCFFPEGLSRLGIEYFSDFCYYAPKIIINACGCLQQFVAVEAIKSAAPKLTINSMELIFELVRRSFYPKMPSRLQSAFAFKTISDLYQWPELIQDNGKLFEIEVPEAQLFCFDSTFLRGGLDIGSEFDNPDMHANLRLSFSPALTVDQARKYWGQELSEQPRMEYLLPLPIQLGREIPLA